MTIAEQVWEYIKHNPRDTYIARDLCKLFKGHTTSSMGAILRKLYRRGYLQSQTYYEGERSMVKYTLNLDAPTFSPSNTNPASARKKC